MRYVTRRRRLRRFIDRNIHATCVAAFIAPVVAFALLAPSNASVRQHRTHLTMHHATSAPNRNHFALVRAVYDEPHDHFNYYVDDFDLSFDDCYRDLRARRNTYTISYSCEYSTDSE